MNISAFSKTYDKRRVLDFPGMELQPGKIYGIIGSNGSGKSTFAKILAGILNADPKKSPGSGLANLIGLSSENPFSDRISVGYMPQKNYAFRMSTKSNILLGNQDVHKADRLIKSLQLEALADKRADRLSGGETARMALARLMMKKFDLLILDEPTAAMDMETTFLAETLIMDYTKENNTTLLLVTHSLQQARRMADEVLFFHKGQLLEAGPKETLLYHPCKPETRQFLEFYGI